MIATVVLAGTSEAPKRGTLAFFLWVEALLFGWCRRFFPPLNFGATVSFCCVRVLRDSSGLLCGSVAHFYSFFLPQIADF